MAVTAKRRRRFGLKTLLLATFMLTIVPAADAMAGRLLVTGHDWDLHCSNQDQQCHYTEVGVRFVRGGSAKPVLILDQLDNDVDIALDKAFSPGFPRRLVQPTSPEWDTIPLTTKRWSAILIASDFSCGGCDLNAVGVTDSQQINARRADIRRYFNAGGGIMSGAGANHGDGDDPDDIYYNFAPLPLGGVTVSPPFTLTPVGVRLGFRDEPGNSDINCCPTHNSFNLPPAGSALRVAERDSEGFAETLIARGQISGGQIVNRRRGRLRLTVNPQRTREDKLTCFNFRVRRRNGRAVKGATIRFGGDRVRTNGRGKATICRSFSRVGRKGAVATKRGFRRDTASVRVVRSPGFTG